jgi:pimeloyl-ACP methyl ester carboxylesterase
VVDWTEERFAEVGGGITLCYQTLGDPSDPPLVLIMGIGSQMITWPDGFCELLASRGLYLIRFDNRDCGGSTWLTEAGVPSATAAWNRELDDPPYLLSDMAADAAGLLDALGIESAHVLGASLGGFIAQTLAIERPGRVRTLSLLMSSTGEGAVGYPSQAALDVLMAPPATDLEGYVEGIVAARRVIGSSGFAGDEAWVRETATRAHARGLTPAGTQRQLVASICSGDRTAELRKLDVPTVVAHGTVDPLIHVSGGRAIAAAIPGAELVEIEGWGHDLPAGVWEQLVDAITANTARTEAVRT